MIYSYCVDDEGRVLSVCPDDLSGTSGWLRGDIPISPADDLTDDHGAALYKLDNGAIVPRSREEREADWPAEPEPEPEPMSAQEMQEAIAEILAGQSDMTAKENYAAGAFFILRDALYQATSPIVKGTEIQPGRNCAKKALDTIVDQ